MQLPVSGKSLYFHFYNFLVLYTAKVTLVTCSSYFCIHFLKVSGKNIHFSQFCAFLKFAPILVLLKIISTLYKRCFWYYFIIKDALLYIKAKFNFKAWFYPKWGTKHIHHSNTNCFKHKQDSSTILYYTLCKMV